MGDLGLDEKGNRKLDETSLSATSVVWWGMYIIDSDLNTYFPVAGSVWEGLRDVTSLE